MEQTQEDVRQASGGKGMTLVVNGKGQANLPDHSVKFDSYNTTYTEEEIVIDIQLFQVHVIAKLNEIIFQTYQFSFMIVVICKMIKKTQ